MKKDTQLDWLYLDNSIMNCANFLIRLPDFYRDYSNDKNFEADRSLFVSRNRVRKVCNETYVYIRNCPLPAPVILRWVGKDKMRGHARKTLEEILALCWKRQESLLIESIGAVVQRSQGCHVSRSYDTCLRLWIEFLYLSMRVAQPRDRIENE